MRRKFKIAFIGAGNMAKAHIRVFNKIESVQLIGIYSRTKKKAEKICNQYKSLKYYNSISDLYKKNKPDLVVITVSVESIKKVCMEASKFNWKCLVEKPFGYNYEEAKFLSKNIKNKSNFFIALNRNFYNSTQNIMRLLKKDNSKRIIQIVDNQMIKKIKSYPKKVLKNFMYANSIHLVDFIRIFARGKLKKIENIFELKTKYSFSFSKKLLFTSGDQVIFTSFWDRPAPWSLNISTEKYFFDMKPLENLQIIDLHKKKKTNLNKIKIEKLYKVGLMRQGIEIIKKLKNKNHYFPGIKEVMYTTNLIKKIF